MSGDALKILQLAHRLPWPPIDGGKKGTLGFVNGYRDNVHVAEHRLLCMGPREEVPWVDQWRATGVDLEFVPLDATNRWWRVLLNTFFSRDPFNMEKYRVDQYAHQLSEVLIEFDPDVVHFDSLHTASYAAIVKKLAPRSLQVLRCHNAEYVILERLAQSQANPLKRWIFGIQAKRLKAYEGRQLDKFDLILAITAEDAARFASVNPGSASRTVVVPAGADLPQEMPAAAPMRDELVRIVHIAAMDWLPNRSALQWFLTEVIPQLDTRHLRYHVDVIGKNMPSEFHAFDSERITVHGFVDNLQPMLSGAHIAAVPLQVGGGMRVKILDYWAQGIPVVTTRVGAEGLADGPERVVALADEPAAFADAIVRLASDPDERETLRVAAFKKVTASYGWAGLIDSVVQRYVTMTRAAAR